jgi:DNA-binding SARP family transcriptional activator
VADLIDAVWGDQPPATARQQMHSAVSALRRTLGDVIRTSPAGYELRLPAEDVDAFAFEALAGRARQSAARGDPAGAVDLWNEALGLWSGPALGGIAHLTALGVGLEERRLSVLEERIETELRLGRHEDLVAELTVLAATYPVRERVIGQLMVALYRCGRAAEALEIYRRAEHQLASELGLDPGPALRQVNTAVLRGSVWVDLDDEGPPKDLREHAPPAQLPPDITGFAGRRAPLATLDAYAENSTAVVVTGPPGVGKSALAVHWAHLIAKRFPDGQLYADLGATTRTERIDPAEVLHGFLEALGVTADRVPSDPAACAGLFRSLVADRRMVVVLDDAYDADQVRGLLPGTPGCLVIVTSRDQMPGLIAGNAARPLRLDVLTKGESTELLAARLGEDRTSAESDAVADIVASCAGLPLALAIVAARAAMHPAFPVQAVARELHPRRVRLDALSRSDSADGLRTTLSSAYAAVSPAAARLFALLGLNPTPDVSVETAARVADVPVERARHLLSELDRVNLLNEYLPGRYTHHDLLRLFAVEVARELPTAVQRAALERIAGR